jgi:ABC-2 type transport system permease protein
MQLKEKMDLSYLRSTRRLIFKLVWLLIEFAAITAVLTLLFHYVKLLGLFSLVHDIPVSVISIVFALMLLLSVVTDTVGLMKSLYFSKDNTVLLTFPATPSLVFLSKLVTYYVYELRKSFMFIVPMFIAFGINKGYGAYYYPWLLLMFVLISTVPVLISALLSIPAMYVYVFLNRVKVLQYVLYATAGVVGVVGHQPPAHQGA